MFKYSYDALVYYGEDVTKSIQRLARFGYDAIELVGEPTSYDPKVVRQVTAEHGMTVSSICSIYNAKRDLAHPDASARRFAIDYVKSVADFAAEVGAPVIIVAPTANGKTHPLASDKEEFKWAVKGIQEAADYARSLNVKLCIEAWNRYETYWLNRLDQCMELMKAVDRPNVGVMGDMFHMNIEESNIADAFRACGDALIHVHVADSGRAAPGTGHLDFEPVLKALKEIDYQGYLSFEILPAAADPFAVMERGGAQEFFDEYTEQCIKYAKSIEQKLELEEVK